MRLFIAVNFSEEIKNSLLNTIEILRSHAERGNFTRKENLHLTVVFLGETSRVEAVERAMEQIASKPFPLKLEGLGRFRRDGGDICWLGIDKNPALSAIYDQLSKALEKTGFAVEKRAYRPHLTLGREVVLEWDPADAAAAWNFPPLLTYVTKISLMKSERVNGKLIYTEIYAKKL